MNYPYKNFLRGLTVQFTSPRYFFASSHPIPTAANIHSRVDRSRYVLFRSTIHSIEEGKKRANRPVLDLTAIPSLVSTFVKCTRAD